MLPATVWRKLYFSIKISFLKSTFQFNELLGAFVSKMFEWFTLFITFHISWYCSPINFQINILCFKLFYLLYVYIFRFYEDTSRFNYKYNKLLFYLHVVLQYYSLYFKKKPRGSVGWTCVAHLSFCFEETFLQNLP